MRCLDLFCGAAGGWTLGLHRAGWKTVAACEADPWRRAVFQHNWPGVVMFDDVRTLTARSLAGLGPLDAIVGSPPCQDASTANTKGRGVDGERTGLFFDAVRLVREVRPRWVCFENVPGLRARGYDRVHDALEAAGYAVRPLVVGAWHAGAPHKRNRVWIIANLSGVGRGQGRTGRPDPGDEREPEQAFHDAVSGGLPEALEGAAGRDERRVLGSRGEAGPGVGICPEAGTDDAHAAPMFGPALARGEPDGIGTGVAADADGRQPTQPGRIAAGRFDLGAGTGRSDARHPDQTRLAQREGEPGYARQEQPTAFGASLSAWDHWNGGAPDLGRVDDGVSRALAARRGIGRACLAAYGDAVIPAITEAIGRTILMLDADTNMTRAMA